jgi:hypothetical protein
MRRYRYMGTVKHIGEIIVKLDNASKITLNQFATHAQMFSRCNVTNKSNDCKLTVIKTLSSLPPALPPPAAAAVLQSREECRMLGWSRGYRPRRLHSLGGSSTYLHPRTAHTAHTAHTKQQHTQAPQKYSTTRNNPLKQST